MKLYDSIIKETAEILGDGRACPYDSAPKKSWPSGEEGELVMMRDAAFELGGGMLPSVNYTCVTTSADDGIRIDKNETVVCGPDLQELHSDVPFARIVFLETEDLGEEEDTEKAYQAVRSLEFVRYHVFPKGYMIRVSAQSQQEQVRVSKGAVKAGITFSRVGNVYIRKYLELPVVKAVRVMFVTERRLVEQLIPNAKKVDAITDTLTHILDGIPTDCGHCQMKPVCDEVDGMRELHMGKRKKA